MANHSTGDRSEVSRRDAHEVAPHHPVEDPAQWGWHGDFPRATQIAGWVTVAILLLMTTATHYNNSGTAWLLIFAAAIALGLVIDRRRHKNAWRR